MIAVTSRFAPIETPTDCVIRISKKGARPYDRILEYLSIDEQNTRISRLRRRGLKVEVFRSSGLGLGENPLEQMGVA